MSDEKMRKFFKNYDYVISLGSTCAPRRYIDFIRGTSETQIFDWSGTPMWAVNEIVKNEFKDFVKSPEELCKMKITHKLRILTHKQYFIRFMHDNIDPRNSEKFDEMTEKFQRRAERFLDVLKSGKKILFVRLQEIKERSLHEDYKHKYTLTEAEYVEKFSEFLKDTYNLNFDILYLNNEKNIYDDKKNIIYVQGNTQSITWSNVILKLRALFDKNCEILQGVMDYCNN